MKIKDNIINYLFDKDYVVSLYDDYVYIFNYNNLIAFSDKRITFKLKNIKINVNGVGLTIVKITKDEVLIKGSIKSVDKMCLDE